MDWTYWVILAILAIAVVGFVVIKVVQFIKLTPEQKRETVKQWLIGAIVIAEQAITTPGAGAEKFKMVVEEFEKKAPLICKLIVKTTKTESLADLIEDSLTTVKQSFGG